MKITDKSKDALDIKSVINALEPKKSEVLLLDDKYYCAICYGKNKKITVLRNTRDSLVEFNCPDCSSLRYFIR